MDKNKYLEPKFSTSIYPIVKFLHKRYPAGSAITNISMLSQSQRGGGPPLGLYTGIHSNFNDSNSLSSYLSQDNNSFLKRGSDQGANSTVP